MRRNTINRMSTRETLRLEDVELGSIEFWSQPAEVRDRSFAVLAGRIQRPVHRDRARRSHVGLLAPEHSPVGHAVDLNDCGVDVEPSQFLPHHLRLRSAEPLPKLALEYFEVPDGTVGAPPLVDEQIQLCDGGFGLVDEGRCLRASHWASSEVFVVRNLEVPRGLCPFQLPRYRPEHFVTGRSGQRAFFQGIPISSFGLRPFR